MRIPNPTPVALPPAEPKTFPDQWIYGLHIMAPTQDLGVAKFELLPYNYETKEILQGAPVEVLTLNLWEALAVMPEVRQIFGMLAMAVPRLRDFVNKTGDFAPPVSEVPPEEPPAADPSFA